MLVKVRKDNLEHFIEVPDYEEEEDKSRKIAFRSVYARREKSYNELVHSTMKCELKKVSEDLAEFLLRLE